jgi:diguanylate cyclase (GGDEF)-like protein
MHKDPRFVKQFLILSTVIIALIVSAVFFSFYAKTQELTNYTLLQQARALQKEMIITRRWVAENGGIYFKQKPDSKAVPHEPIVPGMKTYYRDTDGNMYLMRIPGDAVSGISELSDSTGQYTFHMTLINPRIKATHTPDAFEIKGLKQFAQGGKEFTAIENTKQGQVFRYMTPLKFEDSCNNCHSQKVLKDRGAKAALTINIPMSLIGQQLAQNKKHILYSAILVFTVLFGLLALVSRRFFKTLTRAQDQLLEMATTDGLTGLLNRKTGIARIEEEISRHMRSEMSLSCIMIDIDDFKSINDNHGHLAGDNVLIAVAEILRNSTRRYDIICRYGGEEFLLLLPEAGITSAIAVAEKIRSALLDKIVIFNNETIRFTASFGVTQIEKSEKETADTIIHRADCALYVAKAEGRNKVKTYSGSPNPREVAQDSSRLGA